MEPSVLGPMSTGAPRQHASREWSAANESVALIPAYNEERFIGSQVLAALTYVDKVLVIDDGSSDRTAEIAQRAGAAVVSHTINQGKAAAVNTGLELLRQASARAIVLLDGDGQHCADDIPQVLAPILEGQADIVVGSRFLDVKSDIPSYRKIGQHSLTLATNLTSGIWISDSQSGFRALSALAIAQLSFSKGGFSLESEMQFLMRDHQLRVVEVPIKVIYAEPAKRDPVAHGMQVLNGILQLVGQTRPLLFFGAMGMLSFVAGSLLGLHIIRVYGQTHELAIGYGLITVVLIVVGMLLLFAGMILHSTRGMFLELRESIVSHLSKALATRDAPSEPESEGLYFEMGK